MAFLEQIYYAVLAKTAPEFPALSVDIPMGQNGLANSFTILEGPADIIIKMSSDGNDEITSVTGVDGVTFDQLYASSAAGGAVKIFVAWIS